MRRIRILILIHLLTPFPAFPSGEGAKSFQPGRFRGEKRLIFES